MPVILGILLLTHLHLCFLRQIKKTATALTALMGILTLGIGHLICGIAYVIQKHQMTQLLSKIEAISQNTLRNNSDAFVRSSKDNEIKEIAQKGANGSTLSGKISNNKDKTNPSKNTEKEESEIAFPVIEYWKNFDFNNVSVAQIDEILFKVVCNENKYKVCMEQLTAPQLSSIINSLRQTQHALLLEYVSDQQLQALDLTLFSKKTSYFSTMLFVSLFRLNRDNDEGKRRFSLLSQEQVQSIIRLIFNNTMLLEVISEHQFCQLDLKDLTEEDLCRFPEVENAIACFKALSSKQIQPILIKLPLQALKEITAEQRSGLSFDGLNERQMRELFGIGHFY